jgi:hypothetical protein
MSSEDNSPALVASKLMFRGHAALKGKAPVDLSSWEHDGWGLKINNDGEVVFGAIGSPEHDAYKNGDGPDCKDTSGIDDTQGSIKKTFMKDTLMYFDWKVSSEEDYDFFSFIVGDDMIIHACGEVDWTHCVRNIPAGTEVTLMYSKDCCCMGGSDTMFIKNVGFAEFNTDEDTPIFINGSE